MFLLDGRVPVLVALLLCCHLAPLHALSTQATADLAAVQQVLYQCGLNTTSTVACTTPGVTCACVPANTSEATDGCNAGAQLRVVAITAVPPGTPLPNGVTSILADSIGQLTALSTLQLSGCMLRGSLPATMARLSSLQIADLSNNRFNTTVPEWLGRLPLLRQLNLSSNTFTGAVPDTLCSMGNSSTSSRPLTVQLDNNPQLQGVLPVCLVWPPPAVVSNINGTGLTWPSLSNNDTARIPVLTDPAADAADSSGSDKKLRTTLAWSLPVMAVVCLVVGAACTLLIVRHQQDKVKKQERQRQQEHKQLKQLMYALADLGTSTQLPPAPPTAPSVYLPALTLPDRTPSLLVPQGNSPPGIAASVRDQGQHAWANSKAFAFVVTDIECSTQLSAAAGPALFARLQEIHDNIMRELIAKHGGLEVGTEGDSFTVAFTSVAPAVAFCMEVQYKLLDTAWPPACLKLGPCKPVTGPGGQTVLVGPRVRMGLHWASEGSVAHRLHQLTKQRIFEGPGLQTAQEVGDAAHGGQVLLSHDAWVHMRSNMAAAGFPVVRCLGMYQLESLATPTWLYQATEVVGKPLGRAFSGPRGVKQLWAPTFSPLPMTTTPSAELPQRGLGLGSVLASFTNTPRGHTQGTATPLAAGALSKPVPPSWDLHCMPPPGAHSANGVGDTALTFVVARLDCSMVKDSRRRLPASLSAKLDEVLSTQAQQFRGYVMDTQQAGLVEALSSQHGPTPSGAAQGSSPMAQSASGWSAMPPRVLSMALNALTPRSGTQNPFFGSSLSPASPGRPPAGAGVDTWCIVFESATDALRFCHAAQMALMYTRFSHDCAPWLGEEVLGPDGRALFQGPRVAMAIHTTSDYETTLQAGNQPSPELCATYQGDGVSFAAALAGVAHGGQVVLTESAWDQVKPTMVSHPGAVVALSLGTHVLSPAWPTPQHFMEVLPNLLARRAFPRLNTHMQSHPGYRDAPGTDRPLCIVFVKVHKPHTVVKAQQQGSGAHDMPDDEVLSTIMAYQLAVNSYVAVARQLLAAYGGYECKEPEPGKFTLAFQRLDQAIGWASQLQHELLSINWPAQLRMWPDCAQEVNEDTGQLLWSGLRVRIGMAYGYISSKKPLNTGRADYFGVLANTAARVCALAAPGQVLVDCSDPKAQPVGVDGQPLLREGSLTCLGLRWAPVMHDTEPTLSATTSPGASTASSPRRPGVPIDAQLPPRPPASAPPTLPSSPPTGLPPLTVPAPRHRRSSDGGYTGQPVAREPSQMNLQTTSDDAQAAGVRDESYNGIRFPAAMLRLPSSPGSSGGAQSQVLNSAGTPSSTVPTTGSPSGKVHRLSRLAAVSGRDGIAVAYSGGHTGGSSHTPPGSLGNAAGASATYQLIDGFSGAGYGSGAQDGSVLGTAATAMYLPPSVSGGITVDTHIPEPTTADTGTIPSSTTPQCRDAIAGSPTVVTVGRDVGRATDDRLMPLPTERWRSQLTSLPSTLTAGVAGRLGPSPLMAGGSQGSTPRSAAGSGWAGTGMVGPASAATVLTAAVGMHGHHHGYDDEVELRPLGWYLLRGLHHPKLIYQAQAVSLAGRRFPRPTGAVSAPQPNVIRRASTAGGVSMANLNRSNSKAALVSLRGLLGRALARLPSGSGGLANLADVRMDSRFSADADRSRGLPLLAVGASREGQWSGSVRITAEVAQPSTTTVAQFSAESSMVQVAAPGPPSQADVASQRHATYAVGHQFGSTSSGRGAARPTVTVTQASGAPGLSAQGATMAPCKLSGLRVLASRALHAASTWIASGSSPSNESGVASLSNSHSLAAHTQAPSYWVGGYYAGSSYSSLQQASRQGSMATANVRGVQEVWNSLTAKSSSITSAIHIQSLAPGADPAASAPAQLAAHASYSLTGRYPAGDPTNLLSAAAVAAATMVAATQGFPHNDGRRQSHAAGPRSGSLRQAGGSHKRIGGRGDISSDRHSAPTLVGRLSGDMGTSAVRSGIGRNATLAQHPPSADSVLAHSVSGLATSAQALPSTLNSRGLPLTTQYSTPDLHGPQHSAPADLGAPVSTLTTSTSATGPSWANSHTGAGGPVHVSVSVTRDGMRTLSGASVSERTTPESGQGGSSGDSRPSGASGSQSVGAQYPPRHVRGEQGPRPSRLTGAAAPTQWPGSFVAAAAPTEVQPQPRPVGVSPPDSMLEVAPMPSLPHIRAGQSIPSPASGDAETPTYGSETSSNGTAFSSPVPTEHQPQPSPGAHLFRLDRTHSSGTATGSPDLAGPMSYGVLHPSTLSPTRSGSAAMLSRLLKKPARLLTGRSRHAEPTSKEARTDSFAGGSSNPARTAVNLMQRLLQPSRPSQTPSDPDRDPEQPVGSPGLSHSHLRTPSGWLQQPAEQQLQPADPRQLSLALPPAPEPASGSWRPPTVISADRKTWHGAPHPPNVDLSSLASSLQYAQGAARMPSGSWQHPRSAGSFTRASWDIQGLRPAMPLLHPGSAPALQEACTPMVVPSQGSPTGSLPIPVQQRRNSRPSLQYSEASMVAMPASVGAGAGSSGESQRAQREYAAEVAATYVTARYQSKLAALASQGSARPAQLSETQPSGTQVELFLPAPQLPPSSSQRPSATPQLGASLQPTAHPESALPPTPHAHGPPGSLLSQALSMPHLIPDDATARSSTHDAGASSHAHRDADAYSAAEGMLHTDTTAGHSSRLSSQPGPRTVSNSTGTTAATGATGATGLTAATEVTAAPLPPQSHLRASHLTLQDGTLPSVPARLQRVHTWLEDSPESQADAGAPSTPTSTAPSMT